ncbi:hypothetical protein G7B40_000960 [Aetokthonos hydrillicola Thurmond2011]|jgi:hypothetical protein|uniref:Uncharacterized protein n=1 Tax=Aetokthonos hydrillicola Thurmond2011 TaxID=2712845 RepID=A0AAP5I1U2_9CYAN|nr:hypothetical protein [Aetokthonos hydrillicola]MBO3463170.1 hypothetical protein [Aetokthonos hydrillicola CCALA 1050]MBW4588161.1 hypothetical protein [Aetokthonos hydrillicola CCALA 1050]MDR9893155.1 hypothetical protein [Aetokthonos hydrillicola Thurmond2011]
MQHLSKLLETDNSNLALVLRWGLYGLQAQLQHALKTASADPGSFACQELLKELDILLEQTSFVSQTTTISTEDDSSWEDVFEPVTEGELQLKHIAEAMLADRELSSYIGDYQFYSTNDNDLWNEMQRLLLRVPEKLANSWRSHSLTEAIKLGTTETEQALCLPFTRNECLYPSLTGKVRATGLSLSNRVDFDPRLMVKTKSGELGFLAGVVSVCLHFLEIDPSLHHALKSVERFGVRSVNLEPEKSKLITALIERFRRVQATAENTDPLTALRARLDLDEAIHSLVYLPTCDRYSWWGKLQLEARRTLDSAVERARQAGYQVQIRPLWGTYADIFNWSKDDLQLDIGGVRGEVSACLRVYAKINDEVLPGRVLFRSS